jgi:hypothetical protein
MDDLIEELQSRAADLRRPENFDDRSQSLWFDRINGLEGVLQDLRNAFWDECYAERDK